MAVVISTSKGEKVFKKDVINVGTNPKCDVILETGYDLLLTLEYNPSENKCTVINTFSPFDVEITTAIFYPLHQFL